MASFSTIGDFDYNFKTSKRVVFSVKAINTGWLLRITPLIIFPSQWRGLLRSSTLWERPFLCKDALHDCETYLAWIVRVVYKVLKC